MAYDNYERDLDIDNNLYEEEMYGTDNFGERLDGDTAYDPALDEDQLADDNANLGTTDPATNLEDGFGETITPSVNPHIEDQLSDNHLNREAEADYPTDTASEKQDESLIDKAKDKIDEIIHKDK